jgi:hypothetical protein
MSKGDRVIAAGGTPMKRRGNRNKQALVVQNPSPEKVDSQAITTTKTKSGEQLVDEVIKSACQVTGTRSLDAADRFIAQASFALVWPKPRDADDHLVRASAVMAEMAPQNATEGPVCASSLFRTHWKRLVLKRVRRSKWLLAALCRASGLRLRFEC